MDLLEDSDFGNEAQQPYVDYNTDYDSYAQYGYNDNNRYTKNRREEFSRNHEVSDAVYDQPSEGNQGFTNVSPLNNNENTLSISTSKGFDQEFESMLKDIDPLERLHAIARGETIEEKKTSNSRYAENSLSDKRPEKNKERIDDFKFSAYSFGNESSIESGFTSFGRRKRVRRPSWTFPKDNRVKIKSYKDSTSKTNPNKRRQRSRNTVKALSNFLKNKEREQSSYGYQTKEESHYDYHSEDTFGSQHYNDYDHDHEQGE